MSFLTVFIPSLVLTAVIGAFLSLTWRAARTPQVFAAYGGFALFVHLAWLAVPRLGACAPLARWLQTHTPYNIVAILGNHEEMGDLPKILSIYDQHKSRISLLVNDSIAITRGRATLHIVGVDYPMNPKGGHMLPRPEQDAAMSAQADAAFTGLDKGATILALSHHPAFFRFAAAHGAQLTLASHTHGAQLRLFGRPLIDAYAHLQGLYRRGDSYLDVSAGFGHWLPLRFAVPREIVIVTLHSEPKR